MTFLVGMENECLALTASSLIPPSLDANVSTSPVVGNVKKCKFFKYQKAVKNSTAF